MSKLYIINKEYLKQMKEDIPNNFAFYTDCEKEFDFPLGALKEIRGIDFSDSLLWEMLEADKTDKTQLKAAITLYEGLKISPLLAADESFWAYLTHGPLHKYVATKWDFSQIGNKKVPSDSMAEEDQEYKSASNYVLYHWFFKSQSTILRNGLASLWWGIHISKNELYEDPYELAKVLFTNYTVRTTVFTQVLRMKNVMFGLLKWIQENVIKSGDEDSYALENRGKFIAKYLNQLAGIKQLSILTPEQIMGLLDDVKDEILSISGRKDISNKTSMQIILEQRARR